MLAKAQTLFLDAVAPLSNLTPEVSANAVKTALGLLGNASANLSKERVVKDLNKDAWLRTMTYQQRALRRVDPTDEHIVFSVEMHYGI